MTDSTGVRLRISSRTFRLLLATGLSLLAALTFLLVFSNLGSQRVGDIGGLLGRMLPPRIESIEIVTRFALESLWMAVLGTALAILLSVPLAILAARNLNSKAWLRNASRALIGVARAIPDLVFALVLVRAIGLGPLAGILALGFHSVGMLGRLFADAIEQIDQRTLEALRATGASRSQVFFSAVVPQVFPALVASSLFRLDINLRSASVLGLVGAGGLGVLLEQTLGRLDYRGALGVIAIILIFIFAFELASNLIRRLVISGDDTPLLASRIRRSRGTLPPLTLGDFWRRFISIVAFGLVILAILSSGVSNEDPVSAISGLVNTLSRMFPPDFATFLPQLLLGLAESLSMAILATGLATLGAVPLGLLAAKNLVARRWVNSVARAIVVVVRAVPDIVIAVILVAALGLGPAAGIIALAIGTFGFLPKFVADSAEELDPAPREALIAAGATPVQATAGATIPQLLPAMISHVLYSLDLNLRLSVVVGLVGAGGIGYLLIRSVQSLAFDTTAAIILSLIALVFVLEWASNRLRKATF